MSAPIGSGQGINSYQDALNAYPSLNVFKSILTDTVSFLARVFGRDAYKTVFTWMVKHLADLPPQAAQTAMKVGQHNPYQKSAADLQDEAGSLTAADAPAPVPAKPGDVNFNSLIHPKNLSVSKLVMDKPVGTYAIRPHLENEYRIAVMTDRGVIPYSFSFKDGKVHSNKAVYKSVGDLITALKGTQAVLPNLSIVPNSSISGLAISSPREKFHDKFVDEASIENAIGVVKTQAKGAWIIVPSGNNYKLVVKTDAGFKTVDFELFEERDKSFIIHEGKKIELNAFLEAQEARKHIDPMILHVYIDGLQKSSEEAPSANKAYASLSEKFHAIKEEANLLLADKEAGSFYISHLADQTFILNVKKEHGIENVFYKALDDEKVEIKEKDDSGNIVPKRIGYAEFIASEGATKLFKVVRAESEASKPAVDIERLAHESNASTRKLVQGKEPGFYAIRKTLYPNRYNMSVVYAVGEDFIDVRGFSFVCIDNRVTNNGENLSLEEYLEDFKATKPIYPTKP